MERATSPGGEEARGAWPGNPPRGIASGGAAAPAAARGATASGRWERIAFGAILLLAAVLNLARLDQLGDGNLYYTAAVKSMLTSWSNFFFVSFDPGGFVSVDKPPLGFWVQAASAAAFGVSGWSVILPQAIAGVLSVALLYRLVRRSFGPAAGLLAGLVLALTPIAVAVNRNNTIDALLILTLLGAAWAILRATERSSLRWLLLAAALVGVGFNIKMLQAYLVVPAIFLVYLVGAERRLAARVAHLAAAALVLLVVSFSWATAVELTPEDRRPYVGSSENDSVFNLVLGYNGLVRLLPDGALRSALLGDEEDGSANPIPGTGSGDSVEIGAPGPLRLFNQQLGGQISWLLPLAVLGLVAAWWQGRPGLAGWAIRSERHRALVFWGAWLLTAAGFFSVASLYHRYYLAMMAPPIAALVGAGVAALWADYRRPGRRGWLLPLAVLGTAAVQVGLLGADPTWRDRLAPPIVALAVVAAAGLSVVRWRREEPGRNRLPARALPALVVAGIASALLAPGVWAGYAVWEPSPLGNVLPAAGPGFGFRLPGNLPADGAGAMPALPAGGSGPTGVPDGGVADPAGGGGALLERMAGLGRDADPKLVDYLEANRGDARFLLATTNANGAAPYILATGEPVAALGGFVGQDRIVTNEELAAMVAAGEERFFLVPSAAPAGGGAVAPAGGGDGAAPAGDASNAPQLPLVFANDNTEWVQDTCQPVPTELWQTAGRSGFGGMETLFDCAGGASVPGVGFVEG